MKHFFFFDHDVILCLPFITASLWALGGSGVRYIRRLGVPIVLCAFAYSYGLSGWKFALYSGLILGIIGSGIGYGDDFAKRLKTLYWPYVFLLGFLYGFCQFPVALRFGNIFLCVLLSGVCSLVFGFGMVISKKDFLPWKIAEALTGLSVGAVTAAILSIQ